MPWSKWYPFNEDFIESKAPKNAGIYRLKLENYCFSLINNEWRLLNKSFLLKLLLDLNEPFRVEKYNQTIYTDLIYIGKSENIQNRLLQHLKGPDYNGNKCIYELLKSYSLEFSYLQRTETDYHQAEKNFFKSFIQETGGFCLPCDCCYNECQSEGGNYIPTYIGTLKIC
jgi:hypothetical protein